MATYPVNTLCGGCGGHRDQVHARCGWVVQATRGCLANKSMKKDWNLEKHRSNDTNVVLDAR